MLISIQMESVKHGENDEGPGAAEGSYAVGNSLSESREPRQATLKLLHIAKKNPRCAVGAAGILGR